MQWTLLLLSGGNLTSPDTSTRVLWWRSSSDSSNFPSTWKQSSKESRTTTSITRYFAPFSSKTRRRTTVGWPLLPLRGHWRARVAQSPWWSKIGISRSSCPSTKMMNTDDISGADWFETGWEGWMGEWIKSASARDRTTDLKIFSLTLSQLSYKGLWWDRFRWFKPKDSFW